LAEVEMESLRKSAAILKEANDSLRSWVFLLVSFISRFTRKITKNMDKQETQVLSSLTFETVEPH
jgi:hypothetical protein